MDRKHYERIQRKALEEVSMNRSGLAKHSGKIKAVLLLLFVVVVSALFIDSIMPDPKESRPPGEAAGGNDITVSAAESLAEKFLAAESVEEILEFVAHRERDAAFIRDYYAAGDHPLPMGGSIVGASNVGTSKRPIFGIQVAELFRFGSMLAVIVGESGGLEVEWRSAVGWTQPSLNEVMTKRPTEPTTVKVYLVNDDYFNYSYRDDEEWACFRLFGTSEVLVEPSYGYMRLDHPKLEKIVSAVRPAPAMIDIKFAPGEVNPQAEIVDFRSFGWYELPDEDISEEE